MTILKVEIELGYIDEENNIDDEIRTEIIRAVRREITSKVVQEIIGSTDNDFKKRALSALDTEMDSRIRAFFDEKRTITDSIGRTVKEGVNIDDLLHDRLAKSLAKGNDSSDGMRGYLDRALDHNARLMHRNIDEAIAKASKKAEENMQSLVADKVKTQVADKLTALIMENSSTLALKTSG